MFQCLFLQKLQAEGVEPLAVVAKLLLNLLIQIVLEQIHPLSQFNPQILMLVRLQLIMVAKLNPPIQTVGNQQVSQMEVKLYNLMVQKLLIQTNHHLKLANQMEKITEVVKLDKLTLIKLASLMEDKLQKLARILVVNLMPLKLVK